jgi:hydrogenase-4 component F
MFIGFGTKAGLVPMHAWLPDAHSKAPAPISALLSGLLVTCASYGVIRTLGIASILGAGDLFHAFLMWFGAISTFVAGLLMLTQRDLKRFLAYSTIEHMGIVALGLGFGAPWGIVGAIFHLIAHAFVKPGAFFAAGLLQREYGTTQVRGLHGVLRKGATGHFLLSALTGLAGMPPFPLFFSELVIIIAGVFAHAWGPLTVGMIGLLLAFVAITRVVLDLLAGTPHAADAQHEKKPVDRMEITATAFVLVCACAIGVIPWTPFGAHLIRLERIVEYLR